MNCRYCGHYVETWGACDACLDEVPAIHVGNNEGWFSVGEQHERVDRVQAQCEICGGVIVYEERRDLYICGGYPWDLTLFEKEDVPSCGMTYHIESHPSYDTIF